MHAGLKTKRKILSSWINQVLGGGDLRTLLQASATFYAPRTSSITQTRGAGTPTETRATVATVTNNDGFLVTALSEELREEGARRVRNLVKVKSEDLTNASQWTPTGTASAASATVALFPDNVTYFTCNIATGRSTKTVGNKYVLSFKVSGSGTLDFYLNDGAGEATLRVTLSAIPTVYSITRVAVAGGSGVLNHYFGRTGSTATSVTVEYVQLEDVTAQTTQTAGEYVSVGVLSAPYHGAGVDGVRYFSTDISGAPILAATTKGAVVEAAATNLALASDDLSDATYYTPFETVVTANQAVGSDGATSMDKVAETATTNVHLVRTVNIACSINTTYTCTIDLKQGTQRYATLLLWGVTSSTNREIFTVDLSDGTISTAGGVPANVSVTPVGPTGENIYRCRVTGATSGTDVNLNFYVYLSNNGANSPSYAGDTGKYIYAGKVQVEQNPYATTYQATTTAAVTRNADVLDDQVASNLTAATGTVAFTWTPSHDPSGTVALCGSYVDASNYTALLHDATKYIWRKRIAGVNYDAELTAAYANGTSAKIALYLGASGINLAVDGALGTAHANTDDAQLGTRWQWGEDGNGGQQAGAAFKEMYLTPRASSDSELQALTK